MQERNIQTGRPVDHTEPITITLTTHEAAWLVSALKIAGRQQKRFPSLSAWWNCFARGLEAKINQATQ